MCVCVCVCVCVCARASVCVCARALLSPEILEAGAVKGLKACRVWHHVLPFLVVSL